MRQFKQRARALRRRQTSAEAKLWQALRAHRFEDRKFRRQVTIVDFVCLEAKLVIEVDGDTHGAERELAYDARRTKLIEACGYHVLRVTNADVRDNLTGVLDAIWLELHHRTAL
jgi:very-short-patch-repair endonuclease